MARVHKRLTLQQTNPGRASDSPRPGEGPCREAGAGQEFLTMAEVARRLRLSKTKVWQLVTGGKLPAVRIDRAIRIPAAEFEAWLERQRTDRQAADHGGR